MNLKARMEKVLNEPEKKQSGPFYLKPDPAKVHIGDQLKIESVAVEEAHEVNTNSGPVMIPEKPVVTGPYILASTKLPGETVKATISKSLEKKLYALWGENWVGKSLMVTGIQSKVIDGRNTTWIEWMGLP